MSDLDPGAVDDVLGFWFTELTPEQWFRKSAEVDQRIRDRFSRLHAELAAIAEAALTTDPRTALAAVIVLDQYSRHMFRGTAKAFASDAAARQIAIRAVTAGFDASLGKNERLFLYLPFEHSENAADQARSVALIGKLGDPELTRFAVAHQRIIERFGRFPHRNLALGRASTAAEAAFLTEPESSF